MADFRAEIADASQDLKTIEDFVNLPAGSEVNPRLLPSVNVGTLAGARQAIFEAGGLPATPFKTKALMTASALVDGKYAQVTDDTVNNGLYVKTAGAWVKSAYDPVVVSNTYTDNKVKGFTNNFKTKALMTASALPNDSYAMVTDDTEANNGLYAKTAGNWVKSAYDPLTQSKDYINSKFATKLNINYFKGFDHNAESGFAITFIKNQDASGLRLVGGSYPITLATKGGLDSKFAVWMNVTAAVKNSGNLRVLVQVKKTDKSNAYSAYHDIPATTGWSKVVDINLPTVIAADIEAVYLNIDASGGAELTLKDIYVGESTPTASKRFDATSDLVLRAKQVLNILPSFSKLPIISGVSYTESSITISAGKEFDYTLAISNKSVIYLSALINQSDSKNTRFRLIATPTDGSPNIQRDIYTTAVNGLEFTTAQDFGKPIKSLRIFISAIGTQDITIDRLTISYDEFLQSKLTALLSSKKTYLSDVIDDTAINLATFPFLDYLTLHAGDVVRSKDSIKIANGGSVSIKDSLQEIGAVTGDVLYVNLIGSNVLNKTGTVTISQTQITAANAFVGGSSATLVDGTTYQNIPVTIRSDAVDVQITVRTTGDGEVSFTEYSLSREPIYKNSRVLTLRAKDLTGVTVSDFSYPKLTGYDVIGEAVSYSRSKDANGDYVLTVPVTAATGNGQGARWAIKYDAQMLNKGAYFSIQLASASFSTVKVYIVAKTAEGGIVSEVGLATPLKNDGSWTTWFYRLPAKHTNGNTITEMTLTFYQASTATAPLKIKRPLLSADVPNQYIKHVMYTADTQADTGIALRDRLFDAIQNPVKGVFAVGQQLFRAEKDSPIKVDDFKHLGGRKEMPTKLSNTKYIDASGYEIVTIDSDDTVWLKKSGNTNLYKTTVDDLHTRISATTLDSTSGEQRGTFDGTNLTSVATGFASNAFGKVAGDGSLICVTGQDAKYLPVGASTLSAATGFSDVKGGMLTGWLFDVQDNVVLVGGYSASPNYGQGKINFSNDYGRTYKTILDLENQDVFGATATAGAHIHGCAWDKYWNRVWVVMGDYTIDSKAIGKILWCDNPQSATPVWHIEPRDTIQPFKHNEQHIAVYPMEDCILFGSDCNPSYIARRARVSKDESTYTDMALYLHEGLAYYPAQFWQHKKDLPVTIFLGSDLLDRHGDNPDGVLITYDGVTFSRIWSDKNEYSNTVGRTSSYAYALTKERFVLQKRNDPRFTSTICWVMGRLKGI